MPDGARRGLIIEAKNGKAIAMKRVGTIDEIANAVVRLMSDEACVTSIALDVPDGRQYLSQ